MKRISISLLALAISATACSAVAAAQNYNDGYYAADNPRSDTAQVVHVERVGNQYGSSYQIPSSYQREQCWNEQTNAYDDGYYRDNDGRLYRGDGRTNTGGMLIGALVGGALGNTVGKGDGRKAATIAGAVIGGTIGAHAGNDHDDYQYRDDTSGVVRRCRTVTVTDNSGYYGSSHYTSAQYPSTYERQQCWNEQTNAYDDGYYRDRDGRLYHGDGRTNTGGMIIGALVGGALGNTVGKGDGRKAATIAGAVIGGTIGAHADNDRNDYQYRDDTSGIVRRCRTVTVIDGGGSRYGDAYNVTYIYAGQTYRTLTRYDPGSTIRVMVDIRPQDDSGGYSSNY